MNCTNQHCSADVPPDRRECVVCGQDAGFPNVRAAQRTEERGRLLARFEEAHQSAKARGIEGIFTLFREAASNACAVICLPLSRVLGVAQSDNALYASYYKTVNAGIRIPEDNQWDRKREQLESALFPGYHTEIVYGALSISGIGQTAYGSYSMVLREHAIGHRTSVFDSPLFPFFREHKVGVGDDVPVGYRATWEDRGVLAAAKLGERLDGNATEETFQEILISEGTDTEGECIETHIYGAIHRRAIEHVVGPNPKRKADRVLLEAARERLDEVGVELKVTQ